MKKERNKILIIKISISIVALFLFLAHSFWKLFVDDYYSLILLFFLILPWLDIILKKINLFGLVIDYKDVDDSTLFIKETNIQQDEKIIEFQNKLELILPKKSNCDYLNLKARINYPTEAGAHYIMKITVNGQILNESKIINKSEERIMGDGRIGRWFNKLNLSWYIPYSPDFKTNYLNTKYKITNGDAYLFMFDLTQIQSINDKYEIKIIHTGTYEKESLKNSIIIKDMQII